MDLKSGANLFALCASISNVMERKFVTVTAYSNLWEAEIARSILEAEGISAYLKDGHTINMNWLWSNALGGVKVQVSEEDISSAKKVLAETIEVEAGNDPDTDISVICPRCQNSDVVYGIKGKRWTFLTWVLCGIPLIWPTKKLSCNNCGHSWKK